MERDARLCQHAHHQRGAGCGQAQEGPDRHEVRDLAAACAENQSSVSPCLQRCRAMHEELGKMAYKGDIMTVRKGRDSLCLCSAVLQACCFPYACPRT